MHNVGSHAPEHPGPQPKEFKGPAGLRDLPPSLTPPLERLVCIVTGRNGPSPCGGDVPDSLQYWAILAAHRLIAKESEVL